MSKKSKQTDIQEFINKDTGEVTVGKLNEVIYTYTRRPNGTLRVQLNYEHCPTMAEQHTAHLTDINYLIEKYKPDELQAYINARNQHRQEILEHDFSQEPDLQEAHNIVYQSKQHFLSLPDDIQKHFKNHVEFMKFIDNPKNEATMLRLGLLTEVDLQKLKIPGPNDTVTATPTTPQKEE